MKRAPGRWVPIVAALSVAFGTGACSGLLEAGEDHGAEGEEGGTYIARGETWDATRRGARLVLRFSGAQDVFVGTVQNTTQQTLCAVRVEIHLSSGRELGPTAATDIPPGGSIEIVLPAGGASFDRWTAHPEMSACGG